MKVLIAGNLGYVGPAVIRRLRESFSSAILIGLDMGYFANCLTIPGMVSRSQVDIQYFGDVRSAPTEAFLDIDAVVYLAAISNDPMGAMFADVTNRVNHLGAIELAKMAKKNGARAFVFASSCSVYGFADGPRNEEAPLNPLTAYAQSKVQAEKDLAGLADENFAVTCLRFATACGMSERLRLDLVLNDFVASAITFGEISILSDGTPWRPLIHIKDMARAIDWAIQRDHGNGGNFLTVNVGSDKWNYQVKDLAEAVAQVITGTCITINPKAQADRRSYQVSFKKYSELAPNYQPSIDLMSAVADLKNGLESIQFMDKNFRNSLLIRLNMLKELKDKGHVSENLEWVFASHEPVAL